MIRRIVILAQFSLATVIAGMGLVDLWHDIGWRGRIGERHWARAEVDGGVMHLAHARRMDQSFPPRGAHVPLGFLGEVSVQAGSTQLSWRYVVLRFPLWTAVGALLVHPAVTFIRGPLLRRRRLKRKLCMTCGYDTSGNPTAVCPECGTAYTAQTPEIPRRSVARWRIYRQKRSAPLNESGALRAQGPDSAAFHPRTPLGGTREGSGLVIAPARTRIQNLRD